MHPLLLSITAVAFATAQPDPHAFHAVARDHGFVQGFGATEPFGLQRKAGRLLVLSDAALAGDPAQELERQVGEAHKKRHPKKAFAVGKKWSARIAKFGGEGDVMQVDFDESDIAATDLAASLRASKKFRFVEPDLLIQRHAVGAANRVFDRKGYMGPRASQGDATSVVIAFLDTGLDFDNPLFEGVVKPGKKILSEGSDAEMQDPSEMDYNGHGTQMAGLSVGVAGGFEESAKRNVGVMGVKVMNADGFGSLSDLVKGIQWASEHGAQILNISAGTPQRSELLESVVRSVIKQGIVVVASAGNTASEMREYPSAIPGVVSVGATDKNGRIADFSNHGKDVDIYAQGVELTSIEANATKSKSVVWESVSGTSASSAIVSGALAAWVTKGISLQDSKNRILKDAVATYGSDVRPEEIKVLNAGAVGGATNRDSLVVSAYPTYKYVGLEHKAAFELLVSHASANSVKDRELRMVFDGAKGSKEVVVHTGAIRPFGQARAIASVPVKELCDSDCRIYATLQGEQGLEKHLLGDVSVSAQARATPMIADVWVDAHSADGSRSVRFTAFNRSPWDLTQSKLAVDVRAGVGQGYLAQPENVVLQQDSFRLASNGARTFNVVLPDSLASRDELGAQILVSANRNVLAFKRRDFQDLNSDRVKVFYNQLTHEYQADEAIRLLAMHGIVLPDLNNPKYVGNYIEVGCPAQAKAMALSGYITPSTIIGRTASDDIRTTLDLRDGLNDVDALDVVFQYSGKDCFDSHFWLIDSDSDDHGLAEWFGLTKGHSALTKVRALLYGKAGVSDSKLAFGAIDHYKKGYKDAAYWLLGQALHLVGDMSVPEHVDNDNWHGFYGNIFESWMATNSLRWKAENAWAKGGALNPYRADGRMGFPLPKPNTDQSIADPIRFTMYTTAQVANMFPWRTKESIYSKWGDGNNLYGSNPGPRYERYLDPILNQWPASPRSVLDLNNNTNGLTTLNDNDGDLSVIASTSYVNGIRALAGLLYYFGIETGQIPKLKSNPGMSAIQQLLLD